MDNTNPFRAVLLLVAWTTGAACTAEELTSDQQLIVACHRLDLHAVVALLREGAEVNVRFGETKPDLFEDPWTFARPRETARWTPLIALARSRRLPEPPREVRNTVEDLAWAEAAASEIPESRIRHRAAQRIEIARLLISHNCDQDARDGLGGTALLWAIENRYPGLAKLLVEWGADVNLTFTVFSGFPSGTTPLHLAAWSEELSDFLIKHGARTDVRDAKGRTPKQLREERESARPSYDSFGPDPLGLKPVRRNESVEALSAIGE